VRRAQTLFQLLDRPESLLREDLWRLATFSDLRELSLAENRHLTDGDCVYFGRMPQLVQLDLSNTPITDTGVLELCELPRLETLLLDGTKVTEASLEYLAMLPVLSHLSLEGTTCSPKALRAFHEARPKPASPAGVRMSQVE
jgi:hypothetical protein